jgi:hypothetical protein
MKEKSLAFSDSQFKQFVSGLAYATVWITHQIYFMGLFAPIGMATCFFGSNFKLPLQPPPHPPRQPILPSPTVRQTFDGFIRVYGLTYVLLFTLFLHYFISQFLIGFPTSLRVLLLCTSLQKSKSRDVY